MKYVTILISLVVIFSFLALSQETTTEGTSMGIGKKDIPEKTVASPNASVPNKISYQGILTNSSGAPVADGSYDIKFELFNAVSGGTALWSETQTAVTVSNGTFSVLLGSVTPLIGIFYQPLWVEITVVSGPGIGSPVVFSPRTELASAAYALGPFLNSGDDYYLNSGKLGIGGPPEENFILDSKGSSSFIRAKATSGWSGFVADKKEPSDNNYFILRTDGIDKWVLGTMGTNNFQIKFWPVFQPYIYIDTLGKVGIGTTAPDKLLDVAGSSQIKDTLFIGTTASSGHLNLYRSDVSEPVVSANSSTRGGQLQLFDEQGNLMVDMRPNGWGEGGGVNFYSAPSKIGVEIFGNGWGQGQGYIQVHGDNRSMLFDPRLAGNSSVQLPDSSISAAEMLNEPGIAEQNTSGTTLLTTTTMVDVETISITIPSAGYIIVDAKSIAFFGGTTGHNQLFAQIDETEGGSFSSPHWTRAGLVDYPTTDAYNYFPIYVTRTYYKSTAGTYSFRLEAAEDVSNVAGNTCGLYMTQIKATFMPTAYGPVQTLTHLTEISDPNVDAGAPTQVEDLRELELRVARALAEVERAERELLEARLKQQQPSGFEPH